jgi:hypothetical protein
MYNEWNNECFLFSEIYLTEAVTTLYLEENANALGCTGFSLSVIKLTLAQLQFDILSLCIITNRGIVVE